jgi:3-oxoadipate enol-lactonase
VTVRTVAVPGGRLQVLDEGSGSPIVLLHAGIVDSRAWAQLVARLVPAGFRTVAFDRRGYGASVTDDVEFSNRDDVRAVMDGSGIGRACLVGNSAGGQIAVDVAVETPERVAALVTVGASIGGYEPEPTAVEAALFEDMERLETSGDPEASADFHVRLWLDGIGQPPTRVPAELREEVRAMAREAGDPARVFGRPIPLRPRAAERLGALTMPVLAVAGTLDVSDVPATASHLADSVPAGRAILLPDVAHLVGLEAPDVLAAAILELVEPLGTWH